MVLITRPALALLAASTSLRSSLASTARIISPSFYCPYSPTHTPLDPNQRLFSVMSDTHTHTHTHPHTTPPTAEFLEERLTTLLNSPYIHFTQPHIPGLRLGHGPVDLFSTRFSNYFTQEATGVVCGEELDKDGLKHALLALQKRWNPDTARFVAQGEPAKPLCCLTWTQKEATSESEVTASGRCMEEGGTQRIHRLTLDGEQAMFS